MKDNVISVPVTTPFSFRECLWFLDRNMDDCMYWIQGDSVRKAVRIGDKDLLLEVTGGENELYVTVLNAVLDAGEQTVVSNYVDYWFDALRDLRPFYKQLKAQPALAYMAKEYKGLRLLAMPDLFESLAWAVIGQQINLSFAYKLKRRLVERYGTAIIYESEPYYLFPTPLAIAKADVAELREMQFSIRKAEYLIGIAEAFTASTLSNAVLNALPDAAARLQVLTGIRGIGIWTANYSLMKCLREPSSIPHGDAGLYNALKAHGIIKDKSETEAMQALYDHFKGWESYLVHYLWRSLAVSG